MTQFNKNCIAVLVFCTVLSIYPTPSFSEDATDQGAISAGLGVINCETWLKFEHDEDMVEFVTSWSKGFATGLNMATFIYEKHYKDLEFFTKEFILRRIGSFCEKKDNNQEPVLTPVASAFTDLPTLE